MAKQGVLLSQVIRSAQIPIWGADSPKSSGSCGIYSPPLGLGQFVNQLDKLPHNRTPAVKAKAALELQRNVEPNGPALPCRPLRPGGTRPGDTACVAASHQIGCWNPRLDRQEQRA